MQLSFTLQHLVKANYASHSKFIFESTKSDCIAISLINTKAALFLIVKQTGNFFTLFLDLLQTHDRVGKGKRAKSRCRSQCEPITVVIILKSFRVYLCYLHFLLHPLVVREQCFGGA